MPNRILRDGILDSKAVNSLSDSGELLYRALMSVVDDYGRFEADIDLLRARCFPRKLDRWSPERVSETLHECCGVRTSDGSRLVCVYSTEGVDKKYLQINNFNQRIRSDKDKRPVPSKYPEPTIADVRGTSRAKDREVPSIDSEARSDDGESPQKAAQSLALALSYSEAQAQADVSAPASLNVVEIREPDLFEEFADSCPDKSNRGAMLQVWISFGMKWEEQTRAVACVRRYALSDEVARNIITKGPKWMAEQRRNNWAGDWPRAPSRDSRNTQAPRRLTF